MCFDPFEEYADWNQLDTLEDLLETNRHRFYIDSDEVNGYLKEYLDNSSLTSDRANEIITILNNNKIPDLDQQFNRKTIN